MNRPTPLPNKQHVRAHELAALGLPKAFPKPACLSLPIAKKSVRALARYIHSSMPKPTSCNSNPCVLKPVSCQVPYANSPLKPSSPPKLAIHVTTHCNQAGSLTQQAPYHCVPLKIHQIGLYLASKVGLITSHPLTNPSSRLTLA